MRARRLFFDVIATLALLCSISFAASYSSASVNSLLRSYSVPNSTISSLTMVNLTYGGGNFVALYGSGSLFMVVNVTPSQYSIITNQTQISNVIFNYTVGQSFKQANIAALVADMHAYQNSARSVLNDCWQETGLYSGLGCNSSNNCASCYLVPTCGGYLPGYGSLSYRFGPAATFGAIARLYANATILNDSYVSFYSAANATTESTISTELAIMNSAYNNISAASMGMQGNPLFSLVLTNVQLNECIATTGNPNQPSYCTVFNFCKTLSYNSSAITSVGGVLGQISALPLTEQQVLGIAASASSNANLYVTPVLLKEKTSQFRAILNTTLANYSTAVNSANTLLIHIYNLSLSASVSTLEGNYQNFTTNYLSDNLIVQQGRFTTEITSFYSIYGKINSKYENITSEADNNTNLLIGAQLNSNGANSAQLASYALEEMSLNSRISGRISNYSATKASLDAIGAYARSNYNPSAYSLAPVAVAIYGPFSRIVTAALNAPYPASIAFAPTAAALLTLIIGIIIILLVMLYRRGLKKHKRLMVSRRTSKNWAFVFLILFVIVILLALATWIHFSSVHSTLANFDSAVSGSSAIAVVTNGSDTYVSSCASAIITALTKLNKTVVQYSINANTCTGANGASTSDVCLNSLAASNMPAIILSASSNNSISFSSLYGTTMWVRGNDNFMSQCYASKLV